MKIKFLTNGAFGDNQIIGKIVDAEFVDESDRFIKVPSSEMMRVGKDQDWEDNGKEYWHFTKNEYEIVPEKIKLPVKRNKKCKIINDYYNKSLIIGNIYDFVWWGDGDKMNDVVPFPVKLIGVKGEYCLPLDHIEIITDRDAELEAMEHKIEITERHARLPNTAENRSECHACYWSAVAKSKHRRNEGMLELADMWLNVADIIETTAMRLNPEFKIHRRNKAKKITLSTTYGVMKG